MVRHYKPFSTTVTTLPEVLYVECLSVAAFTRSLATIPLNVCEQSAPNRLPANHDYTTRRIDNNFCGHGSIPLPTATVTDRKIHHDLKSIHRTVRS